MKNDKQTKLLELPKSRINIYFSKISVIILFLFISIITYAQNSDKIRVSGIVSDTSGETLIGASVSEKGTSNAAITGIDGDYSISVSPNATLVVTYVGYDAKEVPVNGKTKIDILVSEDTKLLDEVVVTALGIKRDKKSLGYALSEVKGDQLTETRDNNVANALAGKVAGLQVKQSSTGIGGSSRIVLRGISSMTGNNQPLVVVDGVPINSDTGGTDDFWGNRSVDRGSGMADISPDDIEAISVLKGPAAAALYGSRAGNGVIMITTKTGKGQKGIGISFNTNLTFETPMQQPKYQNKYGQGINGKYAANETGSWGGLMDGSEITDLAGNKTTYSDSDNKLSDFLRTGLTWTNSLDLSSATDKNSIRFSLMNLDNKGVVPNSSLRKTSATLRGTAKLTDQLSFDGKISYITQKTTNRIKLAGDPDNIFRNYMGMPRSVHFEDLKRYADYAFPTGTIVNGTDVSGKPYSWTDKYDGSIRNPYWAAYNNTNDDRKNRIIAFASIKYEFTNWLNMQARYGIDYIDTQFETRDATGVPYWYTSGNYIMNKETSYETNADLLITFNKELTNKLSLIATAGGNLMYSRADGIYGDTNGLIIPNLFTLANANRMSVRSSLSKKALNSFYATASFSYDNTFYLDLTGRNDWTSTLSKHERSYFYPSVSASWLFTESLSRWDSKLDFLNYGKLRLSYAEVGNDTDPYRLYNMYALSTDYVYNPTTEQIETILNGSKSNILFNPNLRAERVKSWEVGLELKALKNRLGIDLAFYNKDATDQIIKMQMSAAETGYSYYFMNAGTLRNKGVELLLTGTPIQTKDFGWDIAVNWSKNSNKLVNFPGNIGDNSQQLSDASIQQKVRIMATPGGSYGEIWGKPYKRNDNGDILINENGLPVFDDQFQKLGNYNPKWMGGINNTFRYKNIDLAFQIDMRYGGNIFLGSMMTGAAAGTLDMTLDGRESKLIGGISEKTGEQNTVATTAQDYWKHLETQNAIAPFIYDATNVRLRELSLGYTVPTKSLRKTPIHGLKFSLVGRNIWMIHSKTKGFDPEASYSTGNAQGIEFGSMPTLSSYGFNLNVTF